jgi:hypothetical protein
VRLELVKVRDVSVRVGVGGEGGVRGDVWKEKVGEYLEELRTSRSQLE